MSIVVNFDKNAIGWHSNFDYNEMKARYAVQYIQNLMKVKGYVYLVTIYEEFGLEWNPDWENTCIRNNDSFKIEYASNAKTEIITITIHTDKD